MKTFFYDFLSFAMTANFEEKMGTLSMRKLLPQFFTLSASLQPVITCSKLTIER